MTTTTTTTTTTQKTSRTSAPEVAGPALAPMSDPAAEAAIQAAARALLENSELGAEEIVKKALTIAGDICVFTNNFQTIEVLDYPTITTV